MNLISLVSEQPIPNIIVSLQLKPENTVLISTKEQEHVANNIIKVLKSNKLKSTLYEKYADAYDFNSVKSLCNQINLPNITLNITGGTKLMSLAAYDCLSNKALAIFYCDTLHNKIIDLKNNTKHNINIKIKLNDYLIAYGYKINEYKNELSPETKKLFSFIHQNQYYNSFIDFSRKVREEVRLDYPNKNSSTADWQYNKNFDKLNIVHLKTKTKFVLDEPKFMHGDWLEQMAFWKIRQLIKELNFDDIAYNIKIVTNNNIYNEIDLAFTKNCKLYMFSCKSGSRDENSALYELETLRQIAGGTFGNAFNIITREPSENYKKRASELRIKIIKISELDLYSFV